MALWIMFERLGIGRQMILEELCDADKIVFVGHG